MLYTANRMRTGVPSWRMLKLMALGAVGFWLPDAVWHAMRGYRFGRLDILFLTLVMPITLLGTYRFLRKQSVNEKDHGVGLPLMLGVWMLGGFFIAVGASFSGGGFMGPDGFRGGVITTLTGLVPPFTYAMATYDGSLVALILVTLGSIVFAVHRHSQGRQIHE